MKNGKEIVLIIDATDDNVVITGRRSVVQKALDLHLHHYIEIDGFIRAEIYDPVCHRGRQIANARLNGMRAA